VKIPKFEAQTEWVKPTEFPDLRQVDEIAIDLETKDPDLIKKGSGSVIGNGEVIGIAVATKYFKGYFPIAHEGGGNMDRSRVLSWLKDILESPSTKVFHNAIYDVCWLRAMGFKINGDIACTMIAAALTDENRFRYDLNSLSWHYLGYGKNEAALAEAAEEWGIDPKSEMYKLPAMHVGAYAERDAEVTLGLWQEMKKEIISQDLEDIFDLESDLFHCLVDMRFKGVRVDIERAHAMKKELITQEKELLHKIKGETNIDTQIWAARSIANVFDAQAREINKAHTTFLDSILRYEHKGRIHAEINQLRNAGGGTVTGRFSYQNPNLQQIPARNKDLGPKIRSLFIPEDGHRWGVFDYSQQEPRLVVHYASLYKLPSVYDVVDAYSNDSSADFHQTVADMADIPRTQAKTINLGLFYGMGKAKLQAELGVTKEKAADLFNTYHSRVPFVKQLMEKASNRAQDRGQIRTLLGRLCRFHLWEPNQFGMHKALPHEEALREHGPGIRRAYTYKALNKLIQGSAADMTKKAMLELYKEGIIPHIQIHDELDLSIENEEQAKKVIEIMEHAVTLEVPNKVDYESGNNWGEING
jgi:DNA polymerase I-like protein with 3'-5' exonuclease and polymerase domains